MKKTLVFVTSLIASVPAFGGGAGWYNVGKVTRVYASNTVFFSTESQLQIDGCSDNNHGYLIAPTETTTSVNRTYALLLAAYLSGKPVAIYADGTCASIAPGVSRPNINSAQITETGYF